MTHIISGNRIVATENLKTFKVFGREVVMTDKSLLPLPLQRYGSLEEALGSCLDTNSIEVTTEVRGSTQRLTYTDKYGRRLYRVVDLMNKVYYHPKKTI